jgi:hypothetical protein
VLLWTAPELLRIGDYRGTPAADIYSFAIIGAELINREGVWNGVKEALAIEGMPSNTIHMFGKIKFRESCPNIRAILILKNEWHAS